MKKTKIIIPIAAVFIVVGIALAVFFGAAPKLKLSIGGESVSDDEYIWMMNAKMYDITKQYSSDYGANVDSKFWSSTFGDGASPAEDLAVLTTEELKTFIATYQLAMEQGYVNSISFADLEARRDAENTARAEKIAAGEAVYGLSNYTLDLYIEYETDNFQKMYCDNAGNEGMNITDEQAQAYYDENKDIYFTAYDDVELEYIRVYYASLDLTDDEVYELKQGMTDISRQILSSETLESYVNKFQIFLPYFDSQTINSDEYSSYSKTIPDVLEISDSLHEGETSQVIDSEGCLYLIKCNKRVEHDYSDIGTVRDIINKNLREQAYDDIITQRANALDAEYDLQALKKFTLYNINKQED